MATQKETFLKDLLDTATRGVEAAAAIDTLREKANQLEFFSTVPDGPGLTDEEIGAVFPGRTLSDVIGFFNSADLIERFAKNDNTAATGFHLAAIYRFAR